MCIWLYSNRYSYVTPLINNILIVFSTAITKLYSEQRLFNTVFVCNKNCYHIVLTMLWEMLLVIQAKKKLRRQPKLFPFFNSTDASVYSTIAFSNVYEKYLSSIFGNVKCNQYDFRKCQAKIKKLRSQPKLFYNDLDLPHLIIVKRYNLPILT